MQIKEIRLAVMGSLINDRFDATARKFALAVKRPERQINDMQHGRKSFGEKVARDFEKELCLPPYYFDQIKNIAPDRIENFSTANATRGHEYEIDPIALVSSIMRGLDEEGRSELLGMAKYLKYQLDHKNKDLPKHNGNQ
jgi:hypothetical protein